MPDTRSDTFKTGFNLLLQAGRRASIALVFIIVARELGAAAYGALAAILALVGLLTPLAGLGVDFSALVATAQERADPRVIFQQAARRTALSGLALAAFAVLILFVSAGATGLAPDAFVMLLVAELLPLKFAELIAKIYQGQGQVGRAGLARLLPALARLGGACLLLIAPVSGRDELTLWSALYLVTAVLSAVLLYLRFRRDHLMGGPATRGSGQLEYGEGLGFAGAVIGLRLLTESDKALVYLLSGSLAAAGGYAAAYRLVELLLSPLSAWLGVIYDRQFAAVARGEGAVLVAEARRAIRLSLVFCLVAASTLWAGLGLIADAVLGADFASMRELAAPLALLAVIVGARMVLDQLASALGLLRARLILLWLAGATALVSNAMLVPSFGWRAAPWVSAMCEAALCAGLFGLLRTRQGRRP